MARSTVTLDATMSGPYFKRGNDMAQATELAQEDAIGRAEQELKSFLGSKVKNSSGAYLSKVGSEKRGNAQVVSDHGTVYGPWLEYGTRRGEKTRFKGYRAWRRARQKAAKFLRDSAQQAVDAVVGRLN